MQPIGKLPVTFTLGSTTYTDTLHIYPDVTGVLLSWKAVKGLHILPECYPTPTSVSALLLPPHRKHAPTSEEIMGEFLSVFDGQIKREQFHISLTDNTQPFCVNTPRAIPFAYWDKLKTELESSLLSRSPQNGTPQSSSLQKRTRIAYECTSTCPDWIGMWDVINTSHKPLLKQISSPNWTPWRAIGYHQCPLDEESQLLLLLLLTLTTNNIHHTFRPIQILTSTLRYLFNCRALQPSNGWSLRRTHGIPTHSRRRHYLWQQHRATCRPRPTVPTTVQGETYHSKHQEVAIRTDGGRLCRFHHIW